MSNAKKTYNLWLNSFKSKNRVSSPSTSNIEYFVNWDETLPDEHEFYKITFSFFNVTTGQSAIETLIITANFKDRTFVASNDGINTKLGFLSGVSLGMDSGMFVYRYVAYPHDNSPITICNPKGQDILKITISDIAGNLTSNFSEYSLHLCFEPI